MNNQNETCWNMKILDVQATKTFFYFDSSFALG